MGKFIIKQTPTAYVFRLNANNNETVCTSTPYATVDGCRGGIESLKKNAPIAPVEDQTLKTPVEQKNPKFELYTDTAGSFRFRMRAANGQIICVSSAYSSKSGAQNGIASIRKNAVESELQKEIEKPDEPEKPEAKAPAKPAAKPAAKPEAKAPAKPAANAPAKKTGK